MPSALAAIWRDDYTKTFPVWGKQVVLRALDNAEVEQVAALVALRPPEHQLQAEAILTVAASLVSVDGQTFTDPESGRPLTLEEKASEVHGWPDVLTASLQHRYTELAAEQRAEIEAVTDPNSSTRPEDSTALS